MLKRSPKSKAATVAIAIVVIVAIYVSLDALSTLRALTSNHGQRVTFYTLGKDVRQGSTLKTSDFIEHEMFENDAPKDALTGTINGSQLFVKQDLPKGTILTKNMLTNSAALTVDSGNRIIFVPTKDLFSENTSNRADLLTVTADSFGAEVIASDARILFDLAPVSNGDNDQNMNPGYFVEVTVDEAAEITNALSQGDVRFALKGRSD